MPSPAATGWIFNLSSPNWGLICCIPETACAHIQDAPYHLCSSNRMLDLRGCSTECLCRIKRWLERHYYCNIRKNIFGGYFPMSAGSQCLFLRVHSWKPTSTPPKNLKPTKKISNYFLLIGMFLIQCRQLQHQPFCPGFNANSKVKSREQHRKIEIGAGGLQ